MLLGNNCCKFVNKSERLVGPDVIRCLAIFCVIAGHFTAINTPFRNAIFDGSLSMWLQAASTPFFAMGVPLFILLTGFLNKKKTTFDKAYFNGIWKVLLAYLICSVITIAFRELYLGEHLSIVGWIKKILDFSAIPYAWYIEMWIGLYLLTPFLNLLWNAIPSKQEKQLLLAVLFALTALPDLLNRYGMYIAPAYWKSISPLLFFFAGRYMAEYKQICYSGWAISLLLIACFLNPLASAIVPGVHTTIQIVGGPNGVITAPLAILLFSRIVFTTKHIPFAKQVAIHSLDMYLCCYMFDRLVYPYFLEHHYTSQSQFGIYFFIVVPLVFIGSFVFAFILKKVLRIA